MPSREPPWAGGKPAKTPTTPQEQIKALKREALEVARRLLEDFPDNPDALIITGNVHAAQGNTAEALKYCQKSLELAPDRAQVYRGMGEVAFGKGEFEEALTLWRKGQQIDPKAPGIHYSLARALINLRRPTEAIVELEREIEISPRVALYHYLLGQACLQVKRYQEAKQHYLQAVDIRPDLWNAHYGLAMACARLGETAEAKQHRDTFKRLKAAELKQAISREVARDDLARVRETVAETYTDAALLYRQQEFLPTAEQYWLRAAALDSKNVHCRELLAVLYQSTRQETKALRMYEQLREIDPRHPVYCINVGIANARLDRFEAAEEALLEAQRLAPQEALAYRTLAELYLRNNRKLSEAKVLAQKAVELQEAAANYSILSQAHDKNGDRQGALVAMRRAVQLDPDNPRYRQIYASLQQKD